MKMDEVTEEEEACDPTAPPRLQLRVDGSHCRGHGR